MTLEFLLKAIIGALVGLILGMVGKMITDHFRIEKLECAVQEAKAKAKADSDGLGARQRNGEWERYKGQLVDVAREKREKKRLWMVEQFLKR